MAHHHSSKLIASARSSIADQIELNRSETERKCLQKKTFEACSLLVDNEQRQIMIKREQIEDCLNRLSKREDISAIAVITFDEKILYQMNFFIDWASILLNLCRAAQETVRNLDSTDVVQAIRLRTKSNEILIMIEDEQAMIALQVLPNGNKPNNQ